MKYYGTISDPKDMVTKEYVDSHSGGGLSIDDVYPVGSIYMSVNSTNPENLFPGTSWIRITDTFLLASGPTYAADDGTHTTATAGSANAIVPYHRHNVAAKNTGAGTSHSHTISHAHTNGSSTYPNFVTISDDLSNDTASMLSGSGYKYPYIASGKKGFSQKAKTGGTDTANSGGESSHYHTLAQHYTDYEGTNGNTTGANMPPYLAVYVWKRVAPAASYSISYEEHTRSAYNLISLSANGSQAADGEWAESAMSGNTIVMVFSGWWQPIVTRTDTSEEIACTKTETIINPNRRTIWTFTMPDAPIYVNEWYND